MTASTAASVARHSMPKDRPCRYCGQSFTSSSLGRHLDQFLFKKRPDGVHDVDEIRRLRGGVTRRMARQGTAKGSSSSGGHATARRAVQGSGAESASPHGIAHAGTVAVHDDVDGDGGGGGGRRTNGSHTRWEGQARMDGSSAGHLASAAPLSESGAIGSGSGSAWSSGNGTGDGKKGGGSCFVLNQHSWHTTGVINDLSLRDHLGTSTGMPNGSGSGNSGKADGWAEPGPAPATGNWTTSKRVNMREVVRHQENARALELALREVLDSIKIAA